ncbi:hypothetical protein BACUNI_02601 [Bacteroides uniformis ATCC 8492]|uniref:Uncharacterized protein n=1 Tax=Bacteroides uniformis (strain ATCC 8492 / DSM 6597 / CCUG 4942 / CIP 103695 / JCM 5828 / KCTC 5204 / NCTC 13054 / VPI 0061) TaxID=411479 RepID=A0ABC9NBB0_BACUC|nr:hypothetical protein BACUNI_02601 [Bacteroides uniformis ATCC 8492]
MYAIPPLCLLKQQYNILIIRYKVYFSSFSNVTGVNR